MKILGFMLKTYKMDIARASILIESFNRFNVDLIPLTLVVPESDKIMFEKFEQSNIDLISEEKLGLNLVDEGFGTMTAGYVNQQIIKLGFWELKNIYTV